MLVPSEPNLFPPEILTGLTDEELRESLGSVFLERNIQAQEEIDRRAQLLAVVALEPAPVPISEFLTQEDLRFHVALFHQAAEGESQALVDLEERLTAQLVVVQRGLTITLSELNERLSGVAEVLREDVNASLSSLENLIVTSQSESESSTQRIEAVEEASGEGGLLGFLGRVAGFALSPIDSLLDTIGAYILGEVQDGLNR